MELNNITPLCELAYKYGTDKCPQIKHAYTPFYYELLNERRASIKKVLEIGVGHFRGMQKVAVTHDPGLSRFYHRGASLYMWRDFFPNALVYGADIRPETIFEDTRIKTYLCDERKKEDLEELIEQTGADIDFVVDDASHRMDEQVFMCQTLMPLLKKDVVYVIEDVSYPHRIPKILSEEYNCEVPMIPKTWSGGWLVVVRKKSHG